MDPSNTKIIQKTFNALESKALDALRKVARRRTYDKGTVLCQQGEIEDTFYIIVDGCVVTTQEMEDGKKRVISTLGANEYFGEMGLIDDTPRMFTCSTLSKTTVLEITEEIFDQLMRESPAVAQAMTRQILSNFRRIDELAIQDLRAKNDALQKAYADLKVAQGKLVEKERMERELELAAELQRSLLPASLPEFDAYAFAGFLRPAHKVGGDLYDLVEIDREHVGLLVADVADKGVQAAMFMAVTRTLFYIEGRRSLSPATVAHAVHRGMMEVAHAFDVFVTAFYAVLHIPTGALTYVRAGHDAPFILRGKAPAERLTGKGRFLGMWEDLQLEEYKTQLAAGDRLVMFSDGLSDAMNNAGEQLGLDRVSTVLEEHRRLPANALVAQIVAQVDEWQGTEAAFDDLTLFVVEAK
jgi:sigma-B regulation protein RsbU (phosphoserine phosphatase)